MAKREQPVWTPPDKITKPVLKLYNSLTRQKEEFVPQNGNNVLWYSCGPTVYDASHMGHARSYITFDILRRVLSDYFGYNVTYVMNITDIDDKIIKRARQDFLYQKYVHDNHSLEKIIHDTEVVLGQFTETVKETVDVDKRQMLEKMLEKLTIAVEGLHTAVKFNGGDSMHSVEEAQRVFLEAAKDPLSDWLDKTEGSSVNDNEIFSNLPHYWESEFHKDMDALNVQRPSVLTRVSEYIPEIISYIEKIIENGLAYASNGSVYFDVNGFDSKEGHHYAKLVPEAYGDSKSLLEGEGDLTISEDRLNEKRSVTDFALWKNSKPGEPWWDSPWGRGRPGWHIECSVMASDICGEVLDIHTGGVDLKFPHHDNEIAQAEAYFDKNSWVRYFLHSGHLTISGCKMSKSLKNFITIQEALKKYSSRQLRLAFLLHSWKETLDYSANTMDMATQYEKLLNEFFLTVKDIMRKFPKETKRESFEKWNKSEKDVNLKFLKSQESIHLALCDNIDTRTALDAIRDLITSCNIYIRNKRVTNMKPDVILLSNVAVYITRIMRIFGAITYKDTIGFPVLQKNEESNLEQVVMPYLTLLAEFRDNIRIQARSIKAANILSECDKLRDDVLPNVGVRLEDREGFPSAVKLVNRETLLLEKEARKKQEIEKLLDKKLKKEELAKTQSLKDAKKKIKPWEMFLTETDKYSTFDSKGFPTHDIDGKELSKGQIKKLQKLQQSQEKKYNDFVQSNMVNGCAEAS